MHTFMHMDEKHILLVFQQLYLAFLAILLCARMFFVAALYISATVCFSVYILWDEHFSGIQCLLVLHFLTGFIYPYTVPCQFIRNTSAAINSLNQ